MTRKIIKNLKKVSETFRSMNMKFDKEDVGKTTKISTHDSKMMKAAGFL